MAKNQCTIAASYSVEGIGLHTGEPSRITFKPNNPDCGIIFIRTDVEGHPAIKADVDNVVEVARGTIIGKDDVRINTIEHVLAAITGMGIDNIICEVNGPEPPAVDGSALPYLKAFKEVGIVEQDVPKRHFVVKHPINYSVEDVDVVVLPYDGFKVSFLIKYDHPVLRTQYASFDIDPTTFSNEIGSARTFSFLNEIALLKQTGLIKGGSLDNAIIIGNGDNSKEKIEQLKHMFGYKGEIRIAQNGILNNTPLRFPNEMVRHKILDLIGDFTLLGAPIKGHVIAARSGHSANVEMVKKLRQTHSSSVKKGGKPMSSGYDITQIEKILPHRYPMLLVDRILEVELDKRIVGIKNVTVNEPFFMGHFPGNPVMPGVLILEAMGQVGGCLILADQEPDSGIVLFLGIDNARFRKVVVPGDQIRFELEVLSKRGRICKMQGRAFVEGALVAEAQLIATLADRGK
jgi:UDP-3-O-[3-hydroxymyristoyl] N-acetylglucosamine deacetylase / 3-hydroxyacyl-[acyl-carrier-protein] dehydratase